MKQLITTICVFVLLVACKTTQSVSQTTQESALDKKWKLIEIGSKAVNLKPEQAQPYLQIKGSEVSGNAGCNSFTGGLEQGGANKIKFSKIASTLRACLDETVEKEFHKVLSVADNYTIKDGVLSLNKGRMAPLAKFKEVDEKSLSGTWELNHISGTRIAFEGLYPKKKPVITFDLDKASANGNASCNTFNLSFETKESFIKFGNPRSTMMACEGGGEDAFFKGLKTITNYSITDNTLNLIMGDIAVMRFQRKN